uniref:N-alpha-acetyltransferase 80 n=1 Tax=Sus scrofa TaxID=9823 RepID=A0A8D1KLR4_PIG
MDPELGPNSTGAGPGKAKAGGAEVELALNPLWVWSALLRARQGAGPGRSGVAATRWCAAGGDGCSASAAPLGASAERGKNQSQSQSQRDTEPCGVRTRSIPEPGVNIGDPEIQLAKLTLDPTHQPELTLSPRLDELTLGSACHPELTLDPARQPEETPVPNLAELTMEPVHCRPELLDACADLINEQWPRSRASRLHSLGQSSDAFPLCLMLLSPHPMPGAPPIVVGHARLSRVLDRPQSLLVETVVVARALRGRGFGRRLMEGLEAFAQARGFHRLHLTTHDQLHFYAHLGYHLGEPVQGLVFTSRRLPATLLSAFPKAPFPQPPSKAPSLTAQSAPRAPRGPLVPPPPPLPEPVTTLPPPPAGPLPQSLLKTQYQDLRGCPIFWMEKDI